jgi:hypothetical protein
MEVEEGECKGAICVILSIVVILSMFGFFSLIGLALWSIWAGTTVLSWGSLTVPLGSGLLGWYVGEVTGLYNYLVEGIYGYNTGALILLIGIVAFAVVLIGNVVSTLGRKTITAVR